MHWPTRRLVPISQLNSCNYERLVNKANSIEEDIKGMPILEQIKYAATLYQKINEVMRDWKNGFRDLLLQFRRDAGE